MTQQWFVVQTKPSSEHIASTNLAAQYFDVFLPLKQITVHHARKIETVTRPLFPRYLFALFDREIDNWGVIRSTRGCIDVLKNGSSEFAKPSPVHNRIIDMLRDRDISPKPEPLFGFAPGEEIIIRVGPWANMPARFLGEINGMATIVAEMFGKAHHLEMPVKDLARKVLNPIDRIAV